MNIKITFTLILIVGILGLACEKFSLVIAVKTGATSDITGTETTVTGTIVDPGNGITTYGHCWSKTIKNPTPGNCDAKTELGTINATGDFTSNINNLEPGTLYYVSAYASGTDETAVGAVITFTTLEVPVPIVTTTDATSLAQTAATLNGVVNANGESTTVTFEYGASTSYGSSANAIQTPVIGNDNVAVSANISGLNANALYHFRVKAVNINGTVYGNDLTFNTLSGAGLPVLTTTAYSNLTTTTASSGGNITSDGGTAVTARGVCWSTSSNPTTSLSTKTSDGTGTGSFPSSITGLTANTTYYVRAYATNTSGTAYGNEISFTTLQNVVIPTLTTTAATNITQTSASSGGNITSDGGANVTARGVCWSTSTNPTTALSTKTTDGTGTGAFSSSISSLTANTTYYVRAYATNSAGTAYGNQVSFITSSTSSTVTDIDGNVYNTVTIGTQVWMKENLKVTKFRDGTAIPTTSPANLDISGESTPTYQWAYEGNEGNVTTYGRLYTFYVAIDSRNICPTGWHVPTDVEWTALTTFLGNTGVAGGKLKESGITHWSSPNEGADNSSGFTALPGGNRNYAMNFTLFSFRAFFWSTTENDATNAWDRYLEYNTTFVVRNQTSKASGFSIRCVKD